MLSEEILAEYKEVLAGLGVRRNLIGAVVNLLMEEAEFVNSQFESELSPDPGDNPVCACAEQGRAAFIATLNPKGFSQSCLSAKGISPADPLPTTGRRRRPRRERAS